MSYCDMCVARADEAAWKKDWQNFEYWWDMFFITKTITFLAQGDTGYAYEFATSVSGRHGGEIGRMIKAWCWQKLLADMHGGEHKTKHESITNDIIDLAKKHNK
jgi:hypothetical protein